MRAFRLIIALFVAALVVMNAPAEHFDNSTIERANTRAVQTELPRQEATLPPEQEKVLTEQTAVVEPEKAQEEPKPVPQQPTGGKYDLMAAAGINPSDYELVDDIVTKESGWQTERWNTQGSGAYGLCQALPASKMAGAGDDYMTNPVTQLKWCNEYAQQYGGWHESKQFRDCTGWCFSNRIAAAVSKDHTWW